MADKTPVRVVFNASNVATGMAEFQTGESIPVTNGGTGLTAVGGAGQVLKVNAAGNALEFGAEGDISITNLVAPTNSDLTLTTSGTGNIVLDAITFRGTTISSADSSIININEGVVVDGTLNTSGQATLSGLAYPTSDGTIGQFLKTDGSGTLAFADLSLGDLTIIGSTISVPSNADFILDPSGTGAIKLNANTDITGNLTVTGTLDLGDSNFTNVGSLQLDSIAGDGDTNTSITFSGSDVITVATGGSTALTVNADQSVSLSGALTVTGVTTLTGGVSTNSVTGDVIPGKLAGTNFTNSLLVGHATTGTLDDSIENTGIGVGALDALTSGDDNTAVGFNAGTAITTGIENTFIGAYSGDASTSGSNWNTGVGSYSLSAVTAGDRNSALGRRALLTVSTGGNNTALGYESGKLITGDNNVTLGYQAGDNITSGDGNVIIGSVDADSATADKQLKIADGVDGTVTWIQGDNTGKVSFPGGDGAGIGILSSTISTAASNSDITLTPHGTGDINLTAGADVNIPANVGLTFGDDAEKIEGDGTDLTIAGNNIKLTAATDVIIPTNVGLHFTDANEKIESDGSKLIITSGGTTFNLPTADGTSGQALVTDGSGTLSFDTVTTTVSDDTRAVVKNNKKVNTSAKTVDYFQDTAFDMAWYFMALNDLTNDHTSGSVFTVCHNNTTAFIGSARGGCSGTGNLLPTTSADIAADQVRVKITGPSADGKVSFYKIPISTANTADATSGNTVTTSNVDVDSASESVDTFAHASFRAAKYTILIDDDAKTETGVTEALVVHDGTNAFVAQFGTVNTGNNNMITLSAAISGSNVVLSAAGLTTNLKLKIHKILLSDSMTAIANSNQKVIGATTVSSTATAFDSFDLDDTTAAVYYVVGKNDTESAYSIQEVYMAGDIGEAGISSGPFVSTKGTTQLEFTGAYIGTADNTVQMTVSATSGASTVVNAYRISCLAEE
jgi:hypothetical protein